MALVKRYCGIREVSEYTSIPIKTLYDWAAAEVLPSIKIQRRVLFDLADIDRFLETLKRHPINPKERARKILRQSNEEL